MSDVSKAVARASKQSKRKGKWANKPEIRAKLMGKPPADLGVALAKLSKAQIIEKKRGELLWRPNDGGAMGLAAGAAVRTSVANTVRSSVSSTFKDILIS